MKNLLIAGLVFLCACSKSFDKIPPEPTQEEKQTCNFGLTEFNLIKRPTVNNEVSKGKPQNQTNSGGNSGNSSGSNTAVIFLDFNGHLVSGTMWNVYGDYYCSPANLTTGEIDVIVQRVTNDFSAFNVTVTTDETVYNAANSLKRMRVVVTESWEWFGQAGGVAYVNSFTWGNNTPCFVFSSLLGYNLKYIAEASSHEAGHTLGLRHQSAYDAGCIKFSEYNSGQGTGETSWAPIMGVSYGRNLTVWHNGSNSISCTNLQNDISIISGHTGLKTDDYSNSTSGASSLSGSLDGVINNSSDIDFFALNLSTTRNIVLNPFSVGINNDGANLDLQLNVYSSQGTLLTTINDATVLHASTTLSPGTYYVSVSTTENQYSTRYGMLGKYKISIN